MSKKEEMRSLTRDEKAKTELLVVKGERKIFELNRGLSILEFRLNIELFHVYEENIKAATMEKKKLLSIRNNEEHYVNAYKDQLKNGVVIKQPLGEEGNVPIKGEEN